MWMSGKQLSRWQVAGKANVEAPRLEPVWRTAGGWCGWGWEWGESSRRDEVGSRDPDHREPHPDLISSYFSPHSWLLFDWNSKQRRIVIIYIHFRKIFLAYALSIQAYLILLCFTAQMLCCLQIEVQDPPPAKILHLALTWWSWSRIHISEICLWSIWAKEL